MDSDDDAIVRRLAGVYDADGSLRGELRYWVGARLGRAHCALCDITHGLVRERGDWVACRQGLPVPFETYHRDDQPHEVRLVTAGGLPMVVGETNAGWMALVDAAELDACAGSVERLVAALDTAIARAGLAWPMG